VFSYFPLPINFTVTVSLDGSLEEMIKEPVIEPAAEGVKVRLTAQELPLARVPQGLSLTAKELSPLFEMEEMMRSEVPVFLMVTCLTGEAVLVVNVPKLTVAGDTDILEGPHDPLIFTTAVGFLGSLEEMVRLAVFDPKDAAVRLTVTVQDSCLSRLAQFVDVENSPAFIPVTARAPKSRVPVPVFLIVTVFEAFAPFLTVPILIEEGETEILGVPSLTPAV
jgi:hypothetical protein